MKKEDCVVRFGFDETNEMVNKLLYQLYRKSYKPDIIISSRRGVIPAAQLANIIGCPVSIWYNDSSIIPLSGIDIKDILIFDLYHTEKFSLFFDFVLYSNKTTPYNKKTATLIESLDTKEVCDFVSTYLSPEVFPVKFWWEHF